MGATTVTFVHRHGARPRSARLRRLRSGARAAALASDGLAPRLAGPQCVSSSTCRGRSWISWSAEDNRMAARSNRRSMGEHASRTRFRGLVTRETPTGSFHLEPEVARPRQLDQLGGELPRLVAVPGLRRRLPGTVQTPTPVRLAPLRRLVLAGATLAATTERTINGTAIRRRQRASSGGRPGHETPGRKALQRCSRVLLQRSRALGHGDGNSVPE
jgi:hypothetical protein